MFLWFEIGERWGSTAGMTRVTKGWIEVVRLVAVAISLRSSDSEMMIEMAVGCGNGKGMSIIALIRDTKSLISEAQRSQFQTYMKYQNQVTGKSRN
ncbi:hypothetical protein OPV22_029947 [Ensete ventricosum]|uniref:Uncharacterized protein n=1 Tax=Ensete ventricosum TaxID=4639 RepID=A0AAV8Q7C4_ENSVE|nr:hypothetical protein OPV22_029947 [Ensete ventricosum]